MARALRTCIIGLIIFGALPVSAQTADQIKAQIDALLLEITRIQAQLGARAGGSVSTPVASCPVFMRSLARGMSGEDVSALQRFLNARGLLTSLPTGFFGALTEAAVQQFQAQQGLVSGGTPDTTGFGRVGPGTRAAIVRLCGGSVANPFPSPIPNQPTFLSCAVDSGVDLVPLTHGESRTFYNAKQIAYGGLCQGLSRRCTNGVVDGDPSYRFLTCAVSTTPNSCRLDGVEIAHGASRVYYQQSTVLFGQTCQPFGLGRTCANGVLSGDSSYRFASCAAAGARACIVSYSTTASTSVAHGTQRTFYSQETVPYTSSCSNVQQTRLCTDGSITGDDTYRFPTCTAIPAEKCELDFTTVAHGASLDFYSARVSNTCSTIKRSRTCTNGVLSGSATYKYAHCAKTGQRWCVANGTYVQHNATATFYSSPEAPFGNQCSQYALERKCVDGVLGGSDAYMYGACTQDTPDTCTLDGKTVAHGATSAFYDTRTVSGSGSCDTHKLNRICTDGSLSGSSAFQFASCVKQ